MGFDSRPALGSSVGGGLWKKAEPDEVSASPSQTVTIDELDLEVYKSAIYVVCVWDFTGDKVKTLMMNVSLNSGQPVESVYNKTGHPIAIGLSTALNGDIITVSLTNNEAFGINFDITRLAVGRP